MKFKVRDETVPFPKYATEGSACFDLTAYSHGIYDPDSNYIEYDTGIAFEIPENHVGLLFPRSSNTKMDLILGNSVGVIDSDYRGFISFRYKPLTKNGHLVSYEKGQRIGQLMIIELPKVELVKADELSQTDRGHNGYGSTGK